jgi:nitroimidazol reductase NimA-like FMN-containing flavoprotein (pyridoxamine 5'-phosphate oxidase superfamily)
MPEERWHELAVAECHVLLGRCHLGRLALVENGMPVILPVNYLMDAGSVVFRTKAGSKLDAAARRSPVAFEVDGIDETNRTGWSVLVRGRAEQVTGDAELTRLRQLPLVPWAPGARPYYVRIRLGEVTGRRVSVAQLPANWWG